MAEKEEKVAEPTAEQPETPESPTPSTPSLVSPEQTSPPPFDADQFVSALSDPRVRAAAVEALRPEWTKDDQSVKDVRIQGLTDDVGRLKTYIQQEGGDVDKAVREMQVDDMLAGRTPASPAGTGDGGNESSQAFMEARTAQLLQGAGIDFEDPDYKMLVAQYGGRVTEPDQWLDVVEGFTAQRQNKQDKQEQIPAAAAASESGGVIAPPGEDLEELTTQLTDLMAQPKTVETMAKRAEIRKQIAEHQSKIDYVLTVDKD